MTRTVDVEEQCWTAISDLWWQKFGSRVLGVAEVWGVLMNHPDLWTGLNLDTKQDRRSSFGLRLRERRDRLMHGLPEAGGLSPWRQSVVFGVGVKVRGGGGGGGWNHSRGQTCGDSITAT